MSCASISQSYDLVYDISIEIADSSTLTDALSRFVSINTLKGDNSYLCTNCGVLVTATKQLKIEKAPPVLMLQLKRFSSHEKKLNHSIIFPLSLLLDEYMVNKVRLARSSLVK